MAVDLSYILPHPPFAVPEIGKGKESHIAAITEGYRRVSREIAAYQPDTIVISSPHAESYSDYIQLAEGDVGIGSFADFGHEEINFRFLYDRELTDAITRIAASESFPAGYEDAGEMALDHGTLVPLYFINQNYTSYKVVRLGLSGLSYMEHYKMGAIIAEAASRLGRKAVYIASGDLSHVLSPEGIYGYREEGKAYDEKAIELLKIADFGSFLKMDEKDVRAAKVCGHRSFLILMGLYEGCAVESEFYGEGEEGGTGYAIFGFKATGYDKERRFLADFADEEVKKAEEARKGSDPYVRLCYEAIEAYARTGKVIKVPEDFPAEGSKKKGCFVTIKKWGRPRGCIGTLLPTKKSLGEEIIANAIEAGTEDPRFPPVKDIELPYLTYEVDVVGKPEPCRKEDLDPSRYGIVFTAGARRSVLLPNLPGIADAKTQIDIARKKAGIPKNAHYSLMRFASAKHV